MSTQQVKYVRYVIYEDFDEWELAAEQDGLLVYQAPHQRIHQSLQPELEASKHSVFHALDSRMEPVGTYHAAQGEGVLGKTFDTELDLMLWLVKNGLLPDVPGTCDSR